MVRTKEIRNLYIAFAPAPQLQLKLLRRKWTAEKKYRTLEVTPRPVHQPPPLSPNTILLDPSPMQNQSHEFPKAPRRKICRGRKKIVPKILDMAHPELIFFVWCAWPNTAAQLED